MSKPKSLLLLLSAIAPALVAGLVLGFSGGGLRAAKLSILAAEYFIALPLLVLICRARFRKRESAEPKAPSSRVMWYLAGGYLLVTLPLAWLLTIGIYQSDESAYLFQARCVQAGALSMNVPSSLQPQEAFFADHVLYQGHLFGKYPFGWPAILAFGTSIGYEWLLNPLLGLVLLLLIAAIAREFNPSEPPTYAVLFCVLSPFFTLNCIGFMPQVLTGVLTAAAAWCYFRWRATKRGALLVGLLSCLGGLSLVRPFTAACIGVVLVGAVLWNLRRTRGPLIAFLGIGTIVALCAAGALLYMNLRLTGSYWVSPYALGEGASASNGTDIGTLAPPTDLNLGFVSLLRTATQETPKRLADTAVTSFPFLFLLAAYGVFRRPAQCALLAALCIALVVGYLVQANNSDSPIGERYYFEAFFALAILGATGWRQLVKDLGWQPLVQRRLLAAMCVIAVTATGIFWDWQIRLRSPLLRVATAAAHPPFESGLIFLEAAPRYSPDQYNFNRPQNPALLYLPDPGASNRAELANRLGFHSWAVLSYDDKQQNAYWASVADLPN